MFKRGGKKVNGRKIKLVILLLAQKKRKEKKRN